MYGFSRRVNVYGFLYYRGVTAGGFLTKSFATGRFKLRIGETYSLRKVMEWLAENGTPPSDYELGNSQVSNSIYNSGMRLKLNDELKLSIQTDPVAAGPSFCETALLTGSKLLYDESLGYNLILPRWNEPEDLFQHIIELRQKLKDKDAGETPKRNTGTSA